MDHELENKLHTIIKLKNAINHSMSLPDYKLRKIITQMIRNDSDIKIEDKQKTIEHFYNILKTKGK